MKEQDKTDIEAKYDTVLYAEDSDYNSLDDVIKAKIDDRLISDKMTYKIVNTCVHNFDQTNFRSLLRDADETQAFAAEGSCTEE